MFLHLDMNSYFATVEQQANPLWRNKPVAVCAYLSNNGCILASSIEAKKLGIKTGCLVAQAKKICPEIIIVENHPYKYLSTTQKIFKILKKHSDRFEPYSIDEGFLDLTGWQKNFKQAEVLASHIRQDIKSHVGEWLKCSIGIAPSKFLAKLASDVAGKDETLVIDNNLDELLGKIKLTDIWGIGKKTADHLNNLNIYTPLEFKNYPVENILTVLGSNGYYLWAGLNGHKIYEVKTSEESLQKSIGHSYCIPNQTTDTIYLNKILFKLCHRAGKKMRQQNLTAGYVWAGYVCVNGKSHWCRQRLKTNITTSAEIFFYAKKCLTAPAPEKVRMLVMAVSNLLPTTQQLLLFNNEKRNIETAIDNLNDKFGDSVIQSGRLFGLNSQAQFRIGFRKTVT